MLLFVIRMNINFCKFIIIFTLVSALQALKKALRLPPRFGWNGDPCAPQQHPWSGVGCQLNKSRGNWVIDGL